MADLSQMCAERAQGIGDHVGFGVDFALQHDRAVFVDHAQAGGFEAHVEPAECGHHRSPALRRRMCRHGRFALFRFV